FTGPTITAQDLNNNTVTSFSGAGNTVNLTETGDGAGGTVTPLTSGVYTSGVRALESITLTKSRAAVTITATRTTGGSETGVSGTFSFIPDALHHFAVTLSLHYALPISFTGPTITAQDLNNNTVTSFSGAGNTVNLTETGDGAGGTVSPL